MSAGTGRKAVTGFVVKREDRTIDPTTGVVKKQRVEVSRVYHSRDAAEHLLKLLRERNPEVDYYIHEKNRGDHVDLF